MTSITRDLRKDLEKTVKQARRIAEAGARQAVQQLRVGAGDAPKDLTTDQRALRTRLRAHGRQLGDRRDAKTGAQETAHLVQECAYEHWHRMLFARFLAETDLLIEPESGVAITLDEVQELAREKATDWLELASMYAERMLPQIFRNDDPVLQITLPPETRSEMEDLLKGLSKQVFEADDSLGWVYQFWQADKKDEVNKSETRIGADELSAVTQLFTEDYMVLFLLHNTLGAWWAGKVLAGDPNLATSASDEATLRAACKVGDIDWGYLRFVRDKGEDATEGPWRPAAGTFDAWPRAAKELTVLDPCMGSGHFLVFALPILVACRISEEGMSRSAAVDAVLQDNLFGLEIDPRCTQIAAFNLAFTAWRKVGHRKLPRLNLACSGLAIGVTKTEWLRLAENAVTAADPAAKRDLLGVEKNLLTVGLEERVKNGLDALYDLFAKAPWLGSLIDPRYAGSDIFREGFEKLEPLLASILDAADTDDTREMAVAAQGMAKAAKLLQGNFILAITNVPYLGRGRQSDLLKGECEKIDYDTRGDLAYTFSSAFSRGDKAKTTAFVMPHNWLFLGSYEKARRSILLSQRVQLIARLGHSAFETISGQVVSVYLSVCSFKESQKSAEINRTSILQCENVSADEKAILLTNSVATVCSQDIFLSTPGCRIYVDDTNKSVPRLRDRATLYQGTSSGDGEKYERKFWEAEDLNGHWRVFLEPARNGLFDGRQGVIRLEDGELQLAADPGARIRGKEAWGQSGFCLAASSDLFINRYYGEVYNKALTSIVFTHKGDELPFLTFATSGELWKEARKIDQKLLISPGSIMDIPFDIEKWSDLAQRSYPSGLIPVKQITDPTQWLFAGQPATSDNPLQTGVARLLGYRWPRQTGSSFDDFPAVPDDGIASQTDADGIVCLTALKGEAPAEQRLNAVLADAFGADWSAAKLASLLAEAGYPGRSLDDWLRDAFFVQHCEQFSHRPFIWHIWDGRPDGFHALVNYHRLAAPNGGGRRTLEKLIYSYLGDWIDRQRADQRSGVEGADARLAHSEHLKAELVKILEGEPPYDIFVRWKPLRTQPIGWDPDINDGIRINIRPFLSTTSLAGKKGGCIIRARPKGKEFEYGKDRGKEPVRDKADYPWFWCWDEATDDFAGGPEFDGNRWNGLHYSRAVKQAARDIQRALLGVKI